jgi:hypothetical protein
MNSIESRSTQRHEHTDEKMVSQLQAAVAQQPVFTTTTTTPNTRPASSHSLLARSFTLQWLRSLP